MANGLFANIMTPEQAEAARQQRMLEQARLASQLTPDQQGAMIAYQSGQRTGGLISDLMGFEPPEVKKARDFQTAVNKVQSRLSPEDLQDPAKVYTEMAKEASSLGYVQEALQFATEANKFSIQKGELRKVSGEQITTKGIRVFRRGGGPLLVEENGIDVAYNPEKHGRFETAADRAAPKSLAIKEIYNRAGQVIGRQYIDPVTSQTVRKEYFEGMEPKPEGAGGKKTMTDDAVRSKIYGEKPDSETTPAGPVRSGRGRPVSNRAPTRPPEFILRGTNRIKNKAYDNWTAQYGATHNPDGTPK